MLGCLSQEVLSAIGLPHMQLAPWSGYMFQATKGSQSKTKKCDNLCAPRKWEESAFLPLQKCPIDWKALGLYEFITVVTVLLQARNWP